MSGKVAAMGKSRACGAASVLVATNCLEAKGSDNGVLIPLSSSLATSTVEASLVFWPFDFWPAPATWDSYGRFLVCSLGVG